MANPLDPISLATWGDAETLDLDQDVGVDHKAALCQRVVRIRREGENMQTWDVVQARSGKRTATGCDEERSTLGHHNEGVVGDAKAATKRDQTRARPLRGGLPGGLRCR